MLSIGPQQRILLAVEPVDFRKGIDGLAAVCRQRLAAEPMSGVLFVFINRRRSALKVLLYDGQGFWLLQKRLSKGRFQWWPSEKGALTCPLSAQQLPILLWNGDPQQTSMAALWRPLRPDPATLLPRHSRGESSEEASRARWRSAAEASGTQRD